METTPPAIAEWIVAGAPVVIASHSRSGSWRHDRVRRATIVRVNKRSFTIDDGTQFSLRDKTAYGRDKWAPSTRCLSADSDDARAALAEAGRRNRHEIAETAVHRWQRDRTPALRTAAITALQALEQDDPIEPEE